MCGFCLITMCCLENKFTKFSQYLSSFSIHLKEMKEKEK